VLDPLESLVVESLIVLEERVDCELDDIRDDFVVELSVMLDSLELEIVEMEL
jgi:hypothetical protein